MPETAAGRALCQLCSKPITDQTDDPATHIGCCLGDGDNCCTAGQLAEARALGRAEALAERGDEIDVERLARAVAAATHSTYSNDDLYIAQLVVHEYAALSPEETPHA